MAAVAQGWFRSQFVRTPICYVNRSFLATAVAQSLTVTHNLHGYICKKQSDAEILEAIGDILAGRIYAPWSLAVAEAGSELGRGEKIREPVLSTDEVFRLTKRQREVLALLARGKSNKEIARLLHIAEATTKIHMAALLRALGVRNRTEAAFKTASLVDILEPAFREPLTLNDLARERMHQLAEAN